MTDPPWPARLTVAVEVLETSAIRRHGTSCVCETTTGPVLRVEHGTNSEILRSV